MPTYSALTTLPGEAAARALAEALEALDPAPYGVGAFEIEDGSGLWEVGGYFLEPPDQVMLEVLATAFGAKPFALSELPERVQNQKVIECCSYCFHYFFDTQLRLSSNLMQVIGMLLLILFSS